MAAPRGLRDLCPPTRDRNGAPCVGSKRSPNDGPPGKKSCLLETSDITAGLCPSAKPALRLGVHWVPDRDTRPVAPLLGAPELGGPTRGSGACGAREGGGTSEHGPPAPRELSSTTDSGSLLGSQGLCLQHGDKDRDTGGQRGLHEACEGSVTEAFAEPSRGQRRDSERPRGRGSRAPAADVPPLRPLGRRPVRSGSLRFASAWAAPGAAQHPRGPRGASAGRMERRIRGRRRREVRRGRGPSSLPARKPGPTGPAAQQPSHP